MNIPFRLNMLIAAAAVAVTCACLWLASHSGGNGWIVAAAAVVFSYSNNTLFSLHHEAVHGLLAPGRRFNDALGMLLAGFFPTIFAVQRISHLGHHRRNRTDAELYDYYLPGQSWALKTYWIYCLLLGFYWSIIPVATAVYMLCPWVFRTRWFVFGPASWWGFRPFVEDIGKAPISTVWPQGLVSISVQLGLAWALDLSVIGWLCCYWAFGLNWSSVQYSDHAGSPRHVTEGAWNLHFWPVARWAFLNYNFHLVHHRQPGIPWIHLPKFVRPGDASPSFWTIYLRLWRGARPAPPGPGPDPLPQDH